MNTKYFEDYKDVLIENGYPNAVPLGNGIWAGEKAYRFDDEATNTIITIKKNKNGFYFSHASKRYGRTGLGIRGFDIK